TMVVPDWSGDAADAFHATLRVEAGKWATASAGMSAMSMAAAGYLVVFDTSRAKAAAAIETYEIALAGAALVRAAWEADGEVGVFIDPHLEVRTSAVAEVETAWQQLQDAGDAAVVAFDQVEEPDLTSGWGVLTIGSMTAIQVQQYAHE